MTFKVRLTRDAEADLDRLFDFLVERELARDGGDLDLPEQAMTALRAGNATLKSLRISAIVDGCFSLIVHGETASARKRWGVRKHQVGM